MFQGSENSKFVYLPVEFNKLQVAALLDSGSSINIMSEELYRTVPNSCKSRINSCNTDTVKLANNQSVVIVGTAHVKLSAQGETHTILVYILKLTSQPLILGTGYLIENKISIDFGNLLISQNIANVRCAKRVTLPPHSELGLWGKLAKNILFGYQDICENAKQGLSQGLMVCKSVVIVSSDRTVPIKLLNPGNKSVVIPKGQF